MTQLVNKGVMGVILAGGASRRMGMDKLRLPRFLNAKETVLDHVIRTVCSVCDDTWVLSAEGHPALATTDSRVHWLADDVPHQGPLKALAALFAQTAQPTESCLVIAGDLPGLSCDVLVACIDELCYEPQADAAVVTREGRLQPLLGCYNADRLREAVQQALMAGTDRLMEALPHLRIVEIEAEGRGWPTWSIKPIHTPDDYKAWLADNAFAPPPGSTSIDREADT